MDESYWTHLSQDTIVKIDEQYPRHHMNPDGIIQWANPSCINDDNTKYSDCER